MTWEAAKDQVAKKYGYKSFDEIEFYIQHIFTEHGKEYYKSHFDEAAELYARSKWNEACKKQIENCCQAYMRTPVEISANKFECITEEMNAIKKASKPEFKP